MLEQVSAHQQQDVQPHQGQHACADQQQQGQLGVPKVQRQHVVLDQAADVGDLVEAHLAQIQVLHIYDQLAVLHGVQGQIVFVDHGQEHQPGDHGHRNDDEQDPQDLQQDEADGSAPLYLFQSLFHVCYLLLFTLRLGADTA